jgi:hypothetical protein
MSILGESIKKVASLEEEASDRTTSAVVKLGQLYAETYTRTHQEAEKVAELLGDRLPQAIKEAQEGAVSNISAFLLLEKTAGVAQTVSAPVSDEAIATFSAATARKFAQLVDPDELADEDVQVGIVRLAMELTDEAVSAGDLMDAEAADEDEDEKDEDEDEKDEDEKEDE